MVDRVDLRPEDGSWSRNGLGSWNVWALDQACGNGTYLPEVLGRTARNLGEQSPGTLPGVEVRKAEIDRVFGLEIMPVVVLIPHSKVGPTLQNPVPELMMLRQTPDRAPCCPTAGAKVQRHDGVEELVPTMPAARPPFRPTQGLLMVQVVVGGWERARTSALRPSVKRRKIKLHHSSKINANVNPLTGRNIQ